MPGHEATCHTVMRVLLCPSYAGPFCSRVAGCSDTFGGGGGGGGATPLDPPLAM